MAERDISDERIASDLAYEIRDKVKEMRKAGVDVSDIDAILYTPVCPGETVPIDSTDLPPDISFVADHWKVGHDYAISSHRKLIGPALVAGRKMVTGEVRRNIAPLVDQQNDYNYYAAATLTRHEHDLAELKKLARLIEKATDADGLKSLALRQKTIDDRLDKFNDSLNLIMSKLGSSGHPGVGIKLDARAFAESFGGYEPDIKRLYSGFMGYFEGRASVLDIGSGRGYFLDLARDRSIGACGIDIDEEAIRSCSERGIKVIKEDALRFVSSLEDASLDGVFMGHIAEHFSPGYFIELIGTISRKMMPGSPMVIAMPNIMNLGVSACSFYLDPTHVAHIHPDYLEFLLVKNSFQVLEKKYYQPTIPAESRLERMDTGGLADDNVRRSLEALNRNIDKLNNLLFGNRDFAIVVKRTGAEK